MPPIHNTGTQIWPRHYTPNTVSTKPSLISIGLGLLQYIFKKKKKEKKRRRFFKIRSKHKCSYQTSNHENLCFKVHASFRNGKSTPKPLLCEKSCLSEVVVPYQEQGACDPQTLTSWYPISTTPHSWNIHHFCKVHIQFLTINPPWGGPTQDQCGP